MSDDSNHGRVAQLVERSLRISIRINSVKGLGFDSLLVHSFALVTESVLSIGSIFWSRFIINTFVSAAFVTSEYQTYNKTM